MTQKEMILSHLLDGKTITNLEAIELYGITRVSDIILKLRRDGYPIMTKTEKAINRYGKECSYGRYKILFKEDSNTRREV